MYRESIQEKPGQMMVDFRMASKQKERKTKSERELEDIVTFHGQHQKH
jgi:hypothetical protein